MSKRANDPLEAAKIGKDAPKKSGWGRKKDDDDTAEDEVQTSAPEAAAPVVKPMPAPVAPVPVKVSGPMPGVHKYKVLKTKTISYNSQMTVLKESTIISSQFYGGMPGIDKLKACGVELELVVE